MRGNLGRALVILAAFGLSGCGSNQAQAEKLMDEMVAEFEKIGAGFESGDKEAIRASIAKIKTIADEGKKIKVTKSEDAAIKAKYEPKIKAAQEKMQKSIMAAATSGKISPADMIAIGNEMQAMAGAIK